MKITCVNPETGNEFQTESKGISSDLLKFLTEFEMSEESIKRLIDGLDLSADAKSLLFKFSKATITVGQNVIKVGRKIIDLVCAVYKEYPSATFGVIFGAIVGFLVTSIPIIGTVLGPIFTLIAIAIGLVAGLIEDLKDKALKRKIEEINAKFSPLGAP